MEPHVKTVCQIYTETAVNSSRLSVYVSEQEQQKGHTGVCWCALRQPITENRPTAASGGRVHRVLVVAQRGRAVVARILDLGEPERLKRANICPADVELEPLRL